MRPSDRPKLGAKQIAPYFLAAYAVAMALSFVIAGALWATVDAWESRPPAPKSLAGLPVPRFDKKAQNEIVLFSNGVEVDRWEMR